METWLEKVGCLTMLCHRDRQCWNNLMVKLFWCVASFDQVSGSGLSWLVIVVLAAHIVYNLGDLGLCDRLQQNIVLLEFGLLKGLQKGFRLLKSWSGFWILIFWLNLRWFGEEWRLGPFFREVAFSLLSDCFDLLECFWLSLLEDFEFAELRVVVKVIWLVGSCYFWEDRNLWELPLDRQVLTFVGLEWGECPWQFQIRLIYFHRQTRHIVINVSYRLYFL